MIGMTFSGPRTSRLSVISSLSSSQGTRWRSMVSADAAAAASSNWRADRLIAIGTLRCRRPASGGSAGRLLRAPSCRVRGSGRFLRPAARIAGRNRAVLGMLPADQRFGADDASAAQADFGLVVQAQSRPRAPGAVRLRAATARGANIHFRAVEKMAGFLACCSPLHRDVGKAQQGGGVVAVFGIDRDTDAGADVQCVRIDDERCS